jgi:dolichyl-phosphate beta-glucosyltransferase
MYLSIVIPAYNEEKRIKNTLLEVNRFLTTQDYPYEIIVADDGSKDGTVELVNNLKEKVKNLRVIDNKKNHGKGYVVRQGIMEAKGKYRLFMDADNATSVDQVKNLLPFFQEGYDVVIGNRDLKESEIKKHQSRFKEILGDIGNILIQILAVPGIKDTQCGFKCFSAKFVEEVFPKLKVDRWGFDIEILALARKFGYKIKTVPVVWINDEESKVSMSGYINTLKELFQIKWNLIIGKYGE